ncbi:DedA family protein [Heyndrickxia sp. NPDC080065]|uniref:DedA family protein n=1 Tax=Heyndrickxia sp. NPDC080065 TaxID=3390568 RepID=UPI003D00F045
MMDYINDYGYLVLFLALMLEMIVLPLPGQTLMSYAGFLVSQGELHWGLSILFAALGSSVGMTVAYGIGYKLGAPFFKKYGHRIHLGPKQIDKASSWFNQYGNKVLIVSYFIPGVRHFTGYFSGIIRMNFRTFAFYAYGGALIWTSTFISLGRVFGSQWDKAQEIGKTYFWIFVGITVLLVVLIFVYRKIRNASRKYMVDKDEKR